MRSPSQDHMGQPRWLNWALASVVAILLLAAALWLCVVVLPRYLYPTLSNADLAGLSPADRAARREGRDKLQNDARTTLLQGLAALLVLGGAGIGAAVTLRQVRIGREQLEQARQQAQRSDERAREQLELAREEARRSDERLRQQIAVAQEGQITERFTRAVDQLGRSGPDRLDICLGGIYALERIAHDSPTHRLAVVEILTAYIRSHAPWPPRLPSQYRADVPIDQVPSLQTRAPDIQAALTVVCRRPTQKDDPHLDLTQTDLRQANLDKPNLNGAWLTEANLAGAQLSQAGLRGARLIQADVANAELNQADLTMAQLTEANLTRTQLGQADLTKAKLGGANLAEAQLTGAKLRRAWLTTASLREAWLGGADLTEAWLSQADLTKAQLGQANLTGAQLEWAYLAGAQLGHANLTKTRLGSAAANRETVWPDGWGRKRRAAAGVYELDEEGPPSASPPG